MTKERLVPELRFPEFDDRYEKTRIEKEFKFIKKYSYARRNEGKGDYYHIHYGDIHSKYNSYINEYIEVPSIKNTKKHEKLKYGDVIIADASEDYEDLGKSVILIDKGERDFIAGLHTFALRKKNNINSLYFLYYTKTEKYKKYMSKIGTGTSVLGITQGNFKNMSFPLPSIKEQEKNGEFFYKIDKKIELQEERIEELELYKEVIMQRVFDKEVRFKNEKGEEYPEWGKKMVGDIISSIPVKQHQILSREIKKEGLYPVVTQSKEYIDGFFDNPSKVCFDYPAILFGDHTTILKYIDFDFIVGGDGVKILKLDSNKYNSKFIYYLLKYKNIPIQGYRRHFSLLRELLVNIPSLKEQNKIVEILSLVDKKIELEKKKLEKYKSFKKGLMQRMFI